MRGTWKEGSFTGDPERYMLSKALEKGVCFHRGPAVWGTWWDALFLELLREGKKNLI
jgi:hypothetical protein